MWNQIHKEFGILALAFTHSVTYYRLANLLESQFPHTSGSNNTSSSCLKDGITGKLLAHTDVQWVLAPSHLIAPLRTERVQAYVYFEEIITGR